VQAASISPAAKSFIEKHCAECHDTETKKGGLDLATLEYSPGDKANFATWVKVHDRDEAAELPPKKKARQGKTLGGTRRSRQKHECQQKRQQRC
jgi:hypothetical protein